MKKLIFILIGVFGLLILLFSGFLITNNLSGGGDVNAMLPPCTVEEGFPILNDDEVTCYWGMSKDILEIPDEVIAANVDVNIKWEKDNVWIGIAEANEVDKCELKGEYYECPKDSINILIGGSSSNGEIIWNPEPGEYRFVVGGDDVQTLQQFNVEWGYNVSIKSGLAMVLMVVGGILLVGSVVIILKMKEN